MLSDFAPGLIGPEKPDRPCWWFIFKGRDILAAQAAPRSSLPLVQDPAELGLGVRLRQYLGVFHGRPAYVAEAEADGPPPAGFQWWGLRALYGQVEEAGFWLAGRASQLLDWDRNNRFCGRCGAEMAHKTTEKAKECPACGLLKYPRLSPAVIVLVSRGDRMLLARSPRFVEGMFSVLAGFVEPGETLEEAVVREIREEVGLEVAEVRYFGSQPWPFPDSLMIGFTATCVGGEIRIDHQEIVSAGWFGPGDLPPVLPGRISIARRLIDHFLAGQGVQTGKT